MRGELEALGGRLSEAEETYINQAHPTWAILNQIRRNPAPRGEIPAELGDSP